jgi:hypothetical protein
MKQFNMSGRARAIVAAAAVGVFASLGGVGYAAGLVHFHHASPASAQYPSPKVTICHHTHSQKNPFVTITVSSHALPAHLGHGDTVGPCSEQQGATATKKHVKAPKVHQNRGHHGDKSHGAKGSKPAKGNHGLAKGHSRSHGPNAVHGNSQAQIKGNGHGKGHSPTKSHGQGHGQGQGQGHGPDAKHGNSGGGKGNGHNP